MSALVVPDALPCAFCDYLSGARPYTILHRQDAAAVLVTREQRGVAHLLVIPTRHVPTIFGVAGGRGLRRRGPATASGSRHRPRGTETSH